MNYTTNNTPIPEMPSHIRDVMVMTNEIQLKALAELNRAVIYVTGKEKEKKPKRDVACMMDGINAIKDNMEEIIELIHILSFSLGVE